jgi:MFS transporter, PPP family, 3-phenylpropionic acid transporter
MNRDLALIRAYFFLWIGAGGFLFPFITLFYNQQGLSGTEIGLLGTVGWGIGLIAAPLWGRWADNAVRPRRLLQISLIGTALFIMLLSQQKVFLWMAFFIALDAIISAGSEPLSTTQALAIVQDQKSGFGSVRLWGSLGWALSAPLCGWLIERTGLITTFTGYALANLASAAVLAFIVIEPRKKLDTDPPRPPIGNITRQLLRDRSMVGLALALSVVWLAGFGQNQFEYIYLEQLGASESLIGIASMISAVIELGGMLLADRWVRKFGAGRILGLSMLLKMVGLAFTLIHPSIASIFAARTLGGIHFSMYSVASIAYTVEGAPEGQGSTILALYFVTLRGLVILFAAPLGGALFDLFGAYWLYAVGLSGNFLGWLILRLTVRPVQKMSAD